MHEDDAKKTAVITKQGPFECDVMPFGLKTSSSTAPATSQKAMMELLRDLEFVIIHIDDIIIFSHTFEEHIPHLRTVPARLQDATFKAAPGEAHLFMGAVYHHGHIVNGEGNLLDLAKLCCRPEGP